MDAQSSPVSASASGVANSSQRRYPRQKLFPLVYVNLDQGNGGIVRDLSERGVALQAVARLRVQQQVYLRFELLQPRTRVEAMGQVIWAGASGQAGVQFTQISQRTRRVLKEWLFFNLLAAADQISSASSIFGDAKRSGEQLVASFEPHPFVTSPMHSTARTGDKLAASEVFELSWWPVPVSPHVLSRMVDSLIVGAAVLVFSVVFLSVTQALPPWPMISGTAVFVTCAFFFFYKLLFTFYCGGTIGAHLAGMVGVESRNDLQKCEEHRFR
jgi:hypothetical protein